MTPGSFSPNKACHDKTHSHSTDSDTQPSSFDSVVAIDAGVDQLLRYSQVEVDGVVHSHGAMFTRGGDDLRTAIFIGGSRVAEELGRLPGAFPDQSGFPDAGCQWLQHDCGGSSRSS